MSEARARVLIRDATLREGLDTPGVEFSPVDRFAIAAALAAAGVDEVEVVAPARVEHDIPGARAIAEAGLHLRRTGLIYATSTRLDPELAAAATVLDRVEMLVPLSPERPPADPAGKLDLLRRAMARASRRLTHAGAGFPNATQVDRSMVVAAARAAVDAGADRVTLYDTNGSADPDEVSALVSEVTAAAPVPIFFHAHNDLGLATANALSAVRAGATGLDVTTNGLGDRAGNASLEQLAVVLHLRGYATGIDLARVPALCDLVARASAVPIPGLAPVVGRHAFAHKSPAHLRAVTVFEAFDPTLVGRTRTREEI